MKKNFESLDTLRTLLALSVATGHFLHWYSLATLNAWPFFLAVDFFFILSGFVLTQSIFANNAVTIEEFLKSFVLRRFFRLYPLYIILFLASSLTIVLKHGLHSDPPFYFVYSALLLQAMGFDVGAKNIFGDTTIGIAWSISIELWIGLLFFPLVFLLKAKPYVLGYSSLFFAVGSLVILINFSPNFMNVNLQHFEGVLSFGAIRGLLGFSLGTICFLFYRAFTCFSLSAVYLTMCEVCITGLYILLFAQNNYNYTSEFIAPLLFFILILCVALEKGMMARLLALPFWASVRSLSYAIYLCHPFYVLLWQKMGWDFSLEMLPLYFALILITASVLYKMIERPWIERGKQILTRQQIRGRSL